MNLQTVYCTHREVALDIRERLSFSGEEDVLRAHDALARRFPGAEHVVISTCNRVELYVARPDKTPAPGREELSQFLAEFHAVPAQLLGGRVVGVRGDDAVRHLFEVAAGIDSMVVGESQIVQQVKKAYELSIRGQASGPLTHGLFQRALKVASRVRSETRVGDGRLSIASVAVGEFARMVFDRFSDKRVVVLGAGEMARETMAYLRSEGATRLTIVNRSAERARELAGEWGGESCGWDEADDALRAADIVVAATGSPVPVLSAERIRRCREGVSDRPLLLLDLGTPRDIEPAAATVDDGVFLYDLDDLEAACRRNREQRSGEITRAQTIVEQEAEEFLADTNRREAGPLVRELRASWSAVTEDELSQLYRRLPDLSEKDRQQVERTVHRITQRLLHPPMQALRDEAAGGAVHPLIGAVRTLFGLSSEGDTQRSA